MFYPEEIVEEVRQRTDIVDLIGSYVRLQKKGSSYMGLCPFHNEKSPSFSVSASRQIFHCFGCGAGGNAFTFVMEYENYTFEYPYIAVGGNHEEPTTYGADKTQILQNKISCLAKWAIFV